MDFKRISVDTSKAVFTVHRIDEQDRPILRRNFSRPAFEAFCVKLLPTEVALEACGSSHHWGRTLSAMGHRVRLIPPHYVKPFVKRGKNDRNDAEAISEAAGRPGMTEVAVKSAERQAAAMVLRVRELLVRNRTQAINALRGHAAEFGVIAAKGTAQVALLLGGKQRLGGISRAGNERLRQLLVVGAMAVIRHAKPGSKSASPWLLKLLERRPRKVAAVAMANKMARVVWAMMARGEDYRRLPVTA